MLRIGFFLGCLLIAGFSFAQGTVRGKVVDPSGEVVIGAKVMLTDTSGFIGKTDMDGNYSIKVPDAKPHAFRITLLGYDTLKTTISVANNQVLVEDFILKEREKIQETKSTTVTRKVTKANDYYMERVKVSSPVSIDYISSETMKKTGDANVTNAVARVSGVSTNGGMITVRGIGDRYIRTNFNGSRIPTLDPLTNNIKLDIFPTALIDNIIISKTQAPDLPGDWAGAYISVETKDYPDKLMVNVESQFGYNVQSTFKDFVTSDRSGTDWLGFDNGFRGFNEGVNFAKPNLNPSNYQSMVALGLGDFYANLGVTGWQDASNENQTYMALGMVELGLLNPSQVNDPAAILAALTTFNSTLRPQAWAQINPNGTSYNNGFSNSWNTTTRKAPINFTQNFSIGNQTTFLGNPLGYIFGFRYGNSVRFDPNGISQRIGPEQLGYGVLFTDDALVSREINSWSMLLNLAYKINDNNKFSILLMPNFSGTNDVGSFQTQPLGEPLEEISFRKNIFYENRQQKIYQYASQHYLPKSKIKIEANISYTDGASNVPDFKLTEYIGFSQNYQITGYQFSPNAGDGIRRYFRYLDENLFDSRLSFELPLASDSLKLIRKLKFGGAYQNSDRNSKMEEYFLMAGNASPSTLQNEDLNVFLDTNQMLMQDGVLGYYYDPRNWDWNHTIGTNAITAAYGLLDFEFNKIIRFNGGLRAEHVSLFSDVYKYHVLGYERNDGRRVSVPGYPIINPGILDEWSFLPSGSMIFKFQSEKKTITNLRMNYSKSVARPNIREMNDAAVYDNEFRTLIYGNSNLKLTNITNYDLRYESYFANKDNFSVSAFYKTFLNHIEMGFGSSGITWDNNENSYVAGLEFEVGKNIGKHLEFRSNVTVVKSQSQFVRKDFIILNNNQIEYFPVDTVVRTMFGQAPYIVNGILSYNSDSLGLTATISYNVQGPRLVIAGILKGFANVYEMPRHTVDFKLSKNLGKYYAMSLTVRDILNAPVRRAYQLADGSYIDFDNFRYGTTFQFGFSYKIQ
ncbi:MAG: hypothetical protein RIR94_623 [Bacteroidota bacterium]|jgi:hypothetical protein